MSISKMISLRSIMALFLVRLLTLPVTSAQDSPEDMLAVHNKERAEARVPLAEWNTTVAAFAEDYGVKYRACDCKLQHSTLPFAENIVAVSPDYTAVAAINLFIGEKKFYDKHTKDCNGQGECGHYANIIAHDSTQIGCAKVLCHSGDFFVICDYWGPGYLAPTVQPGDPKAYTEWL